MNYFSKKNFYTIAQKNYIQWSKIIIVILFLILLIGLLNIFSNQIKNYFYFAFSPINKILWKIGDNTSGFLGTFLKISEIQKENNKLSKDNQYLLAQIFQLKELIRENKIILEKIKYSSTENNFNLVFSRVIGVDHLNDFILINKGSDDGISFNMPVISAQNIVYGKVVQVYKNFSKVMLISHKESVVDVKIQKNENEFSLPIFGIVKGLGGLSIYLDLVKSELEIKEGDILVTSGLEGTFPKDFLIGKIISKSQNDLKPFQTAQVYPYFNVNNLENLFIITNYKTEK